MTRGYFIAALVGLTLTVGEWLPTNRHTFNDFRLPSHIVVVADSPPEGENAAHDKKAQIAEIRKQELTSDCRCPQTLRDSIVFEQVEAAFLANYYDTLQIDQNIIYAANRHIEQVRREQDRRRRRVEKIHQTPGMYEQLRKKQMTLNMIKMQLCCLVKFARQDMGRSTVGEEMEDMRTHPIMKKYGALQAKINKNLGLLSVDLEEYREARGEQAVKLFRGMEKQFNDLAGRGKGYSDDSIVQALREPANMIVVQQLKAYLFMSKMPPNINCSSGVGNWFKGLPPDRMGDIDPKSDCVGYAVSLGKNHNLLILRVRGSSLKDKEPIDRVIALVWRKVREVSKSPDKKSLETEVAEIGAVDLL
jgi:hypothetical protein